MNDLSVRRWTGWFGVASAVLLLVVLGLYFPAGVSPRGEDTAKFTDYVTMHSGLLLTIVLLTTLGGACFLVYLAGLRYVIRQAKPEFEWAAALVFGAGLVYTTLGLVVFTLLGGATLDTINNKADPSVVSALGEASEPALGAIGLIVLALFLASAGYATWGTRVFPRWTAWVAFVGAALSLAAAPSIYAGSGPSDFYTADGYVTFVGLLAYVVWLLVSGAHMITAR